MRVSVCITIYNEEKSIRKLIESLLNQTKKPNEIIIVDGGSMDKTVQIIKHWQKKDKRVRLLVKKCSRSEGRNLSIELANNKIIAMTDAGCNPKKKWLEKLTLPFRNEKVGMIAGFYVMTGNTPIQKAFSVFLGVHEEGFGVTFLPSTRSVAFKKKIWEQIGGFPEDLKDTAEDTVFNIKAIEYGVKMSYAKDAIVEWGMPETLREGINKMYLYAKGDAKSRVWKHPLKGHPSHNMRVFSVILRYVVGLLILILSLNYPLFFYALLGSIIAYIIWIFRKVHVRTKNISSAVWGILIQISSDIAIIRGFITGYINK